MRIHRRTAASALSAAALSLAVASGAAAQKSPEETLQSLKVPDGLEVTLWATEPDLVNPTNMDIDERGRVWITEAANYRGSVTRPEGDRIVILEDTNGDGKSDSAKTFFQDPSLFSPLGICKVGDKLYVAQSPSMLVFTIENDGNGDKPVGKPEVLYTGFTGQNHDHGLHAMVFGPDGRFYFNAGNDGCRSGEPIKDGKGNAVTDTTGSSVPRGDKWRGGARPGDVLGYVEGMAFRVEPDGSGFETLGYNFRNNYEVAPDSFGTAWQSDNDDDGNESVRINYVMEGGNFGYVGPKGTNWGRDQGLVPNQTRQEAHWHQHWPGVVPNMLHTGGGSPTGILVYEGDLLPEPFQGALIHCDPGPNVVRAYVPTPSSAVPSGIMEVGKKPDPADAGAGYAAEVIELVKGADQWFRPSDVTVAPDGSVFICDWYDPGVGGHATGDQKNNGGLRGRIYRLAPQGHKPPKAELNLGTTEGAIAALLSPNLATRYLGYNKLVKDPNAVGPLKELFKNAKNPRHRARALWLLARSAEGKAAVTEALGDTDENIRVTGLRAARLIKMDIPEIAQKLIDDKSPLVLRELALAMNYQPTDKALPILVRLADKYDGQDRWYLEAVGIGATGREAELLAAWKKDGKNKSAEVTKGLTWRLKKEAPGQAAGANPIQQVKEWWALGPFDGRGGGADALDHDFGPDANAAAVDRNAKVRGVTGKDLKWEKVATTEGGGFEAVDFNQFCTQRGARTDTVVGYFATTVVSPDDQKARLLVGSDDGVRAWLNGHPVLKTSATRPLSFPDDITDVRLRKGANLLLVKLVQGNGPGGLAVGVSAPKPVSFSSDVRTAGAETAGSDAGAQADAAAGGQKALKTKDGRTLPPIAALAQLAGDPKRGEAVFKNAQGANCIRCHEVGREGQMIGPPLTTIGQKLSKAQLHEAILLPNAAILMEYENWMVKTKSGKVFSGLKVTDTPLLLSLKDTEGKYHDIPVNEISKKVKQKLSIMPEGLSEAMTQQELVDLVEFLATLRNRA